MEINEIRVNPKNHSRFDVESYPTWTAEFKESLDAMCDINEFLCSKLDEYDDWGARYATWLDNLGIESNSDNGWWSKAAVTPENIEAFLEFQTEENEFEEKCSKAIRLLRPLRELGRFHPRTTSVKKLVEQLDELYLSEK